MFEVYKTSEKCVYEKLNIAIARHICGTFEVKRTPNGKPYIEGNPLFFSISHSCGQAVFALSDSPVGIDLEFIDEKRPIKHTLSRFSEREQAEIGENLNKFYENWVVKEAYIKLIGGTVAHDLKYLEWASGTLYYKGVIVDCPLTVLSLENDGICAIFGDVAVKIEDIKTL